MGNPNPNPERKGLTPKGSTRPKVEVAKSRFNKLTNGYPKLLVRQEKERLAYLKALKDAEADYEYLQELEKLNK